MTERDGEQERTVTYEYDVNGNQVKESDSKSQATTVNEYDAENRLSKAVITMPEPEPLPGDAAEPEAGTATGQASEVAETDGTASGSRIKTITQENLYNGDGQRVRKSEGAKETHYFYQDGVVSYTMEGKKETKEVQNLLGLEGNVILAERAVEISGEPTSEGGTSGEKAEDGAASEETKNRNFDYYLYNKDVQGSTTSILDGDGESELSYEYDDFGETEINGSSVFRNEICYTSGIYDETTGLYYLNARYYDPESGRFLTEDTYRGELNEPDTLHLYAYCKNNPINYVDPSGHWKKFNDIKKDKSKKAKKVIKRYNENLQQAGKRAKQKRESGNTAQLINFQSELKHLKYCNANVAKNGCGIIAVHNVMKLKNKSKNFIQLVAEFDYQLVEGRMGILPNIVKNGLNAYGLKGEIASTVKKFDTQLKKRKYGIVLYSYPVGAHYIAVRMKGKRIEAYNVYSNNYKPIQSDSVKNLLKVNRYKYMSGFTFK